MVKFDEEEIKTDINHLGSEGWEIISIVPIAQGHGWTEKLDVFLKKNKLRICMCYIFK
jgi:hypothetical protein